MARPAILFDRDGSLIEDPGYLSRPEQVTWMDGTFDALRQFAAAGYRLLIITNQSGIGRGLYSEDDMARVHARLRDDLTKAGVTLDGIYHCPHTPEDGCACRKPDIALIAQAAAEHDLDLGRSWMIGDKCSDIAAGQAAGLRTVQVYGQANCTPAPDLRSASLTDAATLILKA